MLNIYFIKNKEKLVFLSNYKESRQFDFFFSDPFL